MPSPPFCAVSNRKQGGASTNHNLNSLDSRKQALLLDCCWLAFQILIATEKQIS